jgi:hypothetical protein
MRGTRVDKLKNDRFEITYFGHFGAGIPSVTFQGMSAKDAHNLYTQLHKALFEKENNDERRTG